MVKYYIIAILSGILSSFAQILLKKGSIQAKKAERSILAEYLNVYVIAGYVLTGICLLMTVFAFRGIPYKMGPVLEALCYLYIMVLSRLFLGEKITKRRLIGNIIICIGVVLFSI